MGLSNKERKRIDKEMKRRKDEQMDRMKSAYDKTYKLIKDTKDKNKV